MNIGLYIKKLRTEQNKTLHQVAIGTNIDATLLSKIERGNRFATNEQLFKLSQFFDIPLETLQTKSIAEKIIKEYGLNEMTFNAIQLLHEEFATHKINKND